MSDMRRAIAEVLRAAATHMIASPETTAAVDRAVTLHDSAVVALTAENERLKQENAGLQAFYDYAIGWAEQRLAARAALPSSRETTTGG